jgi:lipopolysaccharide transport protein LptA
MEVTAAEMTYRRAARLLVYRGEVAAVQEGRTLGCADLAVALDDEGHARTLTCTGQVRLDDRAGGHAATGDRAIYDLPARTLEITGKPASLTRGDGTQVKGPRVVYDLEAGKAAVRSGDSAQAPGPGATGE